MPSESSQELPDHIRVPHLRPVQPIPVEKDGRRFVALRDPAMLRGQTMVVVQPVMAVLQHFNGRQGVDEISGNLGIELEQVVDLTRNLDELGLLWGPTFERFESDLKEKIARRGAFPASASHRLGSEADECRARIDGWLDETEDPEIDGTVIGVVAPHLDYDRGWPNYAAAYKSVQNVEAPDRVIVLGTNHFGLGDGVVLSQYGFESPVGRCQPDNEVINHVIDRLGNAAIIDQLDHVPEHSIELQLPWIQHCWGDVPIVAALVPDPLMPMIEEDDERIGVDRFVDVLSEVLDAVGGRSFVIASADLSHVGPQFGEPRTVDDRRRQNVETHDREMMEKYATADPEEFLGAMRWSANPTRWCSIGNMTAALMLTRPEKVELIDYRQACDEGGLCLVSSAAMVLV